MATIDLRCLDSNRIGSSKVNNGSEITWGEILTTFGSRDSLDRVLRDLYDQGLLKFTLDGTDVAQDFSGNPYRLGANSSAQGSKKVTGIEVTGSRSKDTITGTDKAETIKAGDGDDLVTGAGGADKMDGGRGRDTFVYKKASDSTDGAADEISNFNAREGDRIDLSSLGKFAWGDKAAVAGKPSAWYKVEGSNAQLLVDTNGDGNADMRIDLKGVTSIAYSDLIGVSKPTTPTTPPTTPTNPTPTDPTNPTPPAANAGKVDTASVTEDARIAIVTGNVLSNDGSGFKLATVNGQAIPSRGATIKGEHGTLVIGQDGRWVYTLNNKDAAVQALGADATLPEKFTYTATGHSGAKAESSLTVTIKGANDTPVAVVDTFNHPNDGIKNLDVLANDSDKDASDTLSIGNVRMVSGQGTASAKDGQIVYDTSVYKDLPAGQTQKVVISYEVLDGKGGKATSTVTVNVTGKAAPQPENKAPVATDDVGEVAADGTIILDVLKNDTDPEKAELKVTTASVPEDEGTVRIIEGTKVEFKAAAGFPGPATITYTVSDGTLTDTGEVKVSVTPVTPANKVPVAQNAAKEGNEDTAISGTLQASDGDNDDLTYSVVEGPTAQQGTLELASDGNYTFTPVKDFNGEVTFTYRATDGKAYSEAATVTLNVKAMPEEPVLSLISVEGPAAGVTEGGVATYTFTRSEPTNEALEIQYALSGTATGGDYDAPGKVTFAAGSTTATLDIRTTDDSADELDETIVVTVLPNTGYKISDNAKTASADLIDNDSTPVVDPVLPQVAVSGPTEVVNEGGTFTFTFTRTENLDSPLEVGVKLGGSAVPGQDYTAPVTVTFAPGSDKATLEVQTKGNDRDEDNKTVTVAIKEGDGYTVTPGKANASATILDDDVPTPVLPTISVADASVTEGGDLEFTLTLSERSPEAVTVNVATAYNGSANAEDITSGGGVVTFEPGQTTATYTVKTTADGAVEEAETFHLNLADATNATIADGQAIGTILNDDKPAPVLLVVEVSGPAADVTEGGIAAYTFTRDGDAEEELVVHYTLGGSAVAGDDFTAPATTTVTFAAGSKTATLEIQTKGDELDESNKDIVVTINKADGYTVGATRASATAALLDDDEPVVEPQPLPTVTVTGGGEVTEGGVITFTFHRGEGDNAAELPILWQRTGGQIGDADIEAIRWNGEETGYVGFQAGSATATVTFVLADDAEVEDTESFGTLALLPSDLYQEGETTAATGSVLDNDEPPVEEPVLPTLSVGPASLSEDGGEMVFTVTLSAAAAAPVTFAYATVDGVALAGTDYEETTGQATIPADRTSVEIRIPITDDQADELDESFTLRISDVSGATAPATLDATGTINDDDDAVVVPQEPPVVSIGNATASEAAGSIEIPVTLSHAALEDVTLTYEMTKAAKTVTFDNVGAEHAAIPAGYEGARWTGINSSGDGAALTATTGGGQIQALSPNGLSVTSMTVSTASTNQVVTFQAIKGGTVVATETVTLGNGGPQSAPVTLGPQFSGIDALHIDGAASSSGDYPIKIDNVVMAGGPTTTGQVTIAAGQTAGSITVPVVNDSTYEAGETISVKLTGAANAALGTDVTGVGTITNDDGQPLPQITFVDVYLDNVEEGGASQEFDVVRDGSLDAPLNVTLESALFGNQTVTIPAGEAKVRVFFGPLEDQVVAESETYEIKLAPSDDYLPGAVTTVSGRYIDNDGNSAPEAYPLTFSTFENTLEAEGLEFNGQGYDNQQWPLSYKITEQPTAWGTVVLTDVDYGSGPVFKFTPKAGAFDNLNAGSEQVITFTYVAKDGVGGVSDPATVKLTVWGNNEAPAAEVPVITTTDAPGQVTEGGMATFGFLRTGDLSKPLTVNIEFMGGATAGQDYTAPTTVTFAAGSATASLDVQTARDAAAEETETIEVRIANGTGYTVGANADNTTDLIDGPPPAAGKTVSIADAASDEGRGVRFTITLSEKTETPIPVTWELVMNGSADAGDFAPTVVRSGTVTFNNFAANLTERFVNIPTLDDLGYEGDETFTVRIATNVPGVTITDAEATGTIRNNDAAPSVPPGVTLSEPSLAVTEGQEGATFTFKLNSAPTADVTVQVSAGNELQASGPDGTSTLVFTAANWNVPQTVTVTAPDDAIVGDNLAGQISFTTVSQDPGYQSLTVAPVEVAITDNDTPAEPVVLSIATTTELNEDSTISWNAIPGAASYVLIGIEPDEPNFPPHTLGFAVAPNTSYDINGNDEFTGMVVHVEARDADGKMIVRSENQTDLIANLNDDPTGRPMLSDNTPEVGQLLTISISDLADGDGMRVDPDREDEFGYIWQRSTDNGVTWNLVQSGDSYTVTQDDVGHLIRGAAQYTDRGDTLEVAYSLPTAIIGDPNPDTAPVATDDTAPTPRGQAVEINVLENDLDSEGDPMSVELNGQPANGSVTVQDGIFLYTPREGFVGTDTFEYTLNGGDVGKVTVTVTQPEPLTILTVDGLTEDSTLSWTPVPGAASYVFIGLEPDDPTAPPHELGFALAPNTSYDINGDDEFVGMAIHIEARDAKGVVLTRSANATGVIENINDEPTGNLALSDMTPEVGQTLTLTIGTFEDGDGYRDRGREDEFGWAIEQSQADGTWVEVARGPSPSKDGPFQFTYTVTQADQGAMLRGRAIYEDRAGDTIETVYSLSTERVGVTQTGGGGNGDGGNGPGSDPELGSVKVVNIVAATEPGADGSPGVDGSFEITLADAPTANVIVTLNGDNQVAAQGADGSTELVFTPQNWNTPQKVTVIAIQDAEREGPHTGDVWLDTTSEDPRYNGVMQPQTVNVSDGAPEPAPISIVTVANRGGDVTEGGDLTFNLHRGDAGTNPPEMAINWDRVGGTIDEDDIESVIWNGDPNGVAGFKQGAVTATVTFKLRDDAEVEGTEDFGIFTVLQGDGYLWDEPYTATANVLDNDVGTGGGEAPPVDPGLPVMGTGGITVTQTDGNTEVAEGGPTDTVTVALTKKPSATVYVSGHGDEQVDSGGRVLEFTPENWETPQEFVIGAFDDTVTEDPYNGAVTFTTDSEDWAYVGVQPTVVAVTVGDNDAPNTSGAPVVQSPNHAYPVDEDTVETDGIAIVPLGTDPNGKDLIYMLYGDQPDNGTVTWNPADGNMYFKASPGAFQHLEDGQDETVTFQYVASNGTDESAPAQMSVLIRGVSDVPTRTLSVSDVTVPEGGNAGYALVKVTLSSKSPHDVRFNYTTVDDTGVAGTDYTTEAGVALIPYGQTEYTISVPISQDAAAEPDKAFKVVLSNPVNAVIADGEGAVTITNDDGPVVEPPPPAPAQTVSVEDVAVVEGFDGGPQMGFKVKLSQPVTEDVQVHWETTSTTAADGTDWENPGSGTLTFFAGDEFQELTVMVPVFNDGDVEGDETINFRITSVDGNATIEKATATGTILDDDVPVEEEPTGEAGVFFSKLTYNLAEEGNVSDSTEVYLTRKPTAPVTIGIGSDGGVAFSVNGGDAFATQTLTFTPENWKTPQVVTVVPEDDTAYEGPHGTTVYFEPITSEDPLYQEVFPTSGYANIADNDTAPPVPPPTAEAMSANVWEDNPVVALQGNGFSEHEFGITGYKIVNQPVEGGSVVMTDDRTFKFEGDKAFLSSLNRGESAPISFEYAVQDGAGTWSAPATMTFNVYGLTNGANETVIAQTTSTQPQFLSHNGGDGIDTLVFNNVALGNGTGLEIALDKSITNTNYGGKVENFENLTIKATSGNNLRTMTVGGNDQNNVITVESTTHKLTMAGYSGDDTFNFTGSGQQALLSTMTGGAGNDTVNANSGVTISDRGGGNDIYNLGAGVQHVNFYNDVGSDTISGFTRGADKLHFLEGTTVASTAMNGADTVITTGAGGTVTVKNVALTPSDWLFV